METLKGNYDMEFLKYQQASRANLKEDYCTKLYNTITDFNDSNNMPLSSLNIPEAYLRVMREDEEVSIMDSTTVTADVFSNASISQRENSNVIFASEKLENSDNLVDLVANMEINNVRYDLNTATASDAQVEFVRYPEKLLTPATEILIKNY